jgi:hypothetical protein
MTCFGRKQDLLTIWAEDKHWDDLLKDPKNKADYGWFRTHTCHWAGDIKELLGPRLTTRNHAYTIQSATSAVAIAASAGVNIRSRRPLPVVTTDDELDVPSIKDMLDENSDWLNLEYDFEHI